jgi:2-methylcitrate dehydratase PrpD
VSEFIVGTCFEDLPPEVVHFVKRNILNEIGCALGARGVPSSDIAVEIVSELGGTPESSVFGYGFKTSCANAAFANAIVAYALEMNDDHRLGTGHPAVATNAATLAVAESRHAPGKQVLVAQVRAKNSSSGSAGLSREMYHEGFHPRGLFDFCHCLRGENSGLNKQQMVDALGNTGSAAAGLSNVLLGPGSDKAFMAVTRL